MMGSIILKIVIVLLVVLLVSVIAIPTDIWSDEDKIISKSRYNMEAINEAQQFLFRRANRYTTYPDSLVLTIQNDSTLQQKRKLVELTNEIYDILKNTLNINTIKQILTVSEAVTEIQGDFEIGDRYIQKYEDLVSPKEEIYLNLTRFDSSASFPKFGFTKSFVDSLDELRDKINEYRLQETAYLAQKQIDSVNSFLLQIERDNLSDFWSNQYLRIKEFISLAEKTDIKKATNLLDRLGKFSDRINNGVKAVGLANLQKDINSLREQKENINQLYQKFISPENFRMTQRFGLLNLTDTDSMLITLGNDNFNCPDSDLPYIINVVGEKDLTIESPNLLDDFQRENIAAIEPIKNLELFNIINSIDEVIDSTINFMEEQKVLIRRKTDLLLSLKELQAELKDLNSSPVYRYTKSLKSLIDTVQTEKRVSVLKPIFEDNLNAMDTLAFRLENANVEELGKKLNALGQKIQQYDSLVTAAKLPVRIQKQTKSVYPVYKPIFSVLNNIRSSLNPEEGALIKEAADNLENSLLKVLNGYNEPVYVIFSKKHINHGYIHNGEKSWEVE